MKLHKGGNIAILKERDLEKTKTMMNVVLIGLDKLLPEPEEQYELHRLLSALLSKELTVEEKLNIIETEYNIPVKEEIREDVSVMCNLSQGIREDAIEAGIEIGEKNGEKKTLMHVINSMHQKGFSIEQIADILDRDIEEVKAVVEGKEIVTV